MPFWVFVLAVVTSNYKTIDFLLSYTKLPDLINNFLWCMKWAWWVSFEENYKSYWTDDISDKFLYDEGAAVNIHEENCVIQLPTSQHVQTNIHQHSLLKKAQSQLQWTLSKRNIFVLGIFLVQRITTLKYNTSNQGIIFLTPS